MTKYYCNHILNKYIILCVKPKFIIDDLNNSKQFFEKQFNIKNNNFEIIINKDDLNFSLKINKSKNLIEDKLYFRYCENLLLGFTNNKSKVFKFIYDNIFPHYYRLVLYKLFEVLPKIYFKYNIPNKEKIINFLNIVPYFIQTNNDYFFINYDNIKINKKSIIHDAFTKSPILYNNNIYHILPIIFHIFPEYKNKIIEPIEINYQNRIINPCEKKLKIINSILTIKGVKCGSIVNNIIVFNNMGVLYHDIIEEKMELFNSGNISYDVLDKIEKG